MAKGFYDSMSDSSKAIIAAHTATDDDGNVDYALALGLFTGMGGKSSGLPYLEAMIAAAQWDAQRRKKPRAEESAPESEPVPMLPDFSEVLADPDYPGRTGKDIERWNQNHEHDDDEIYYVFISALEGGASPEDAFKTLWDTYLERCGRSEWALTLRLAVALKYGWTRETLEYRDVALKALRRFVERNLVYWKIADRASDRLYAMNNQVRSAMQAGDDILPHLNAFVDACGELFSGFYPLDVLFTAFKVMDLTVMARGRRDEVSKYYAIHRRMKKFQYNLRQMFYYKHIDGHVL